ncbi:MAG: amino acid adenylation domain-containing protein, partial [Williamsia sp.]|nr:amino acid adenylation domain-containing protein [Williamsia sp.]
RTSKEAGIEVQVRPQQTPLSFSQERLWFIHQLEGSIQYHLPYVLRWQGPLDRPALSQAFQYIINRHEVLRTVILYQQEQPWQHIKDEKGWTLQVTDETLYIDDPQALQHYVRMLVETPFDLSNDYPLRAALIRIGREDHMLVVTIHHIAADGWSMSVLVKELLEVYTALSEGRAAELPSLKIQYADYAIWQKRNWENGKALASQLQYWKERLQGVSIMELPTDHRPPAVPSRRGAAVSFETDGQLLEALKLLSHQQGTTLFMTLLAAFAVLLRRYSGETDICVGTPVANRNRQDTEDLIGFFINTLALRIDLSQDPTFIQLLQQVKATTLEAYEHQEVPFEKVVGMVANERNGTRNPLFQVLFSMHNTPQIPELRIKGVCLLVEDYQPATSQLDMSWNITNTLAGMHLSVVYDTSLFAEQKIKRMGMHFMQLLKSAVRSAAQPISSLAMLSSVEEHQLVVQFNDTKRKENEPATIVTLFEEQVVRTPDAPALVFEDHQLTYFQLNERANQLAWHLKARGVKRETPVPICMERSIDMSVGILAILKSGGAYVPVDPGYPPARISYLIKDAGAWLMICDESSRKKLEAIEQEGVSMIVPAEEELISRQETTNPEEIIRGNQLAYVIYTSGSTGKPKGVMIEHASLSNYLVNTHTRYLEDTAGAGSFVHLPYSFDASLTALFMPLLAGKLVVISSKPSMQVFDDPNLHKYAPYDFIKITPSHLDLLRPKMRLESGKLLTRRLVIGGEALQSSQLQFLLEEGWNVQVVNEYGPTEATVGSSVYCFETAQEMQWNDTGKTVPIGKPIEQAEIYILGKEKELLPIGVPGEICIGGAGVARGYLKRGELTAEKFVKNPYSKEGSKLYRTGDTGVWMEDGNLQYIGRQDEQVKIRGYRIELGEIENVLKESGLVNEAIVVAREDATGTKRLVAYIVEKEGIDKAALQQYAHTALPHYMVPVQWAVIEAVPLTVNGKVDRKALPDPGGPMHSYNRYVAPRSEKEKVLASIWQDVLKLERVGVEDDFFSLGGYSLLALRLISQVRNFFGVELQISDIFTHQTISALAQHLAPDSSAEVLPPLKEVQPRPEHIPLSFNQERLWFIDQLQGSIHYHVPAL